MSTCTSFTIHNIHPRARGRGQGNGGGWPAGHRANGPSGGGRSNNPPRSGQ